MTPNRFFGKVPWGPMLDEDAKDFTIDVPVGKQCMICGETIGPEDQGTTAPMIRMHKSGAASIGSEMIVQHRECLCRIVLGSATCQRGEHDHASEAKFSMREQGRRALAEFERRQRAKAN